MLKELAYECPNGGNTTVVSGFRSCSILTQMHFACIRAEIDFRHIADEERVATTMALPQALVYGQWKDEN